MTSGIAEFLHSTELFACLSRESLDQLVLEVTVVELGPNQNLIAKGEVDDKLYVVVSGALQVIREGNLQERSVVADIAPGECVREMAILSDDPAAETIISAGSRLLALSRPAFERFSTANPQAALNLMEALSTRLQRDRLSAALQQIHPFDTLGLDALRDLKSELEMFTLYGGEVLFRQGERGDSLYIVIRGRLRVSAHDKHGIETTIAELGAGELVGEMAVVTGEFRTATVTAIRDTQVAMLSRSGFESFMLRHARSAVETISRKLAERLKETTTGEKAAIRGVSTVALIPAHDNAPLAEVCAGLKLGLEKFGRVAHLRSTAVDRRLGKSGIAQTYERGGSNIRLVEWLNDQEMTHEFVLYESDATLSPWSERCVRQADHILVVADGESDPAIRDIESELLGSPSEFCQKRQWLVLLHKRGYPSGTARWLQGRNVDRHFHVRSNRQNDFDRVARFLTGRAIGLTLGGGFARGLAHVGAFRACEELGVPIDAIGGASMGAMIGAMWVMGWDSARVVDEICAGCSKPFNDLTFPFIAFKGGKFFSRLVRRFFGDLQIEDLWIPFFCISANLNRSELKIHTHGSLAKAVLATTRAPGVFPPVVYEGDLHIDGGVINNVPVDIMKPYCNQGITIGIDVSPPHELNPVRDYGDDVSGWQAFWRRLSPFTKKHIYTPSILLVMIRTLEFSGVSYKSLRLKSADIYMYPDLLKFKRTDFHLADGIVNAGYECMNKNLLEWLLQSEAVNRRPDLVRTLQEKIKHRGIPADSEISQAQAAMAKANDRAS